MRLQFLSKRRPQQRDLVSRPYGRFFNLPRELAARGHDVELIVVSHAGDPAQTVDVRGLKVHCLDFRTLGPVKLYRALIDHALQFGPEWVVAFSDMHYGWLARRMALASGAQLAIDAYDNYEAYMPWNLPLRLLWRRSLAAADLVTAAGPQLAGKLQRSRSGRVPVHVLPMCADDEFQAMDRAHARQVLGLPPDAPLVGYIGSWGRRRGTDVLAEAFPLVHRARPDARLVLSGRPPPEALVLPAVLPVGYLPDEHIPVLTSALDVACVICDDTAFGSYSYPAKLCEAMACGTRVAASATAPISWMLGASAAATTVPLADPPALAERILQQLNAPPAPYPARPTWHELAGQLEHWLQAGLRS